jgi:RNA polymerase-binding protein DksA
VAKAKPSKKPSSKSPVKSGSKPAGKGAGKGARPARAGGPAKVAGASKGAVAAKAGAIKSGAKAAAKGAVKAGAKPEVKAAGKAGVKVAAKAVGAAAKAESKPEPKGAGKVALKAAAKPEVRVVAKAVEAAKAPVVAAVAADDKSKPKGITIVDNKPGAGRKPPKPKKVVEMPQLGPPLLGAGKKWKPLIVSGPNAPKAASKDIDPESLKGKSPLSKKDLEHFRTLLLKKRGELVGDVSTMESAALHDASGSLSNTPQHVAEQGSEAYEQSLSLGIAEVDRQLIREIDEALRRIADGSFGLCQKTGRAISKERLDELPWTRLSIEAAREHEKRTFFPRGSSSESARSGAAASGD